jgi:Methylase involved in ubiquinone/menaquinone biosynthesis
VSQPQIYPKGFARHYDQDYEILRHEGQDVTFYTELAAQADGPVAEVGCGTGRVLLSVARAGARVVGFDPSPAMLAGFTARLEREPAEVRERVELRDGHFGHLPHDGGFGLVFSAFRAFQHLASDEQQLLALREMARVTAPGGLLAFDVFDYDPRRAKAFAREHVDYLLEVGEQRHERRSRARFDPATQLIHARFRWLVDGTEVDAGDFTLRVSSAEHLLQQTRRAGLLPVELFGDFDHSAWDPETPREIVLLARRPGP